MQGGGVHFGGEGRQQEAGEARGSTKGAAGAHTTTGTTRQGIANQIAGYKYFASSCVVLWVFTKFLINK